LTIEANSLAAPDAVVVSGINASGYNGTFVVTSAVRAANAPKSTTLSYPVPKNPGPYSSGGVVTYPHILLFNAAKCYTGANERPLPPTNVKVKAQ